MKLLSKLVVLALSLTVATSAFAEAYKKKAAPAKKEESWSSKSSSSEKTFHKMAGCGLGSMVIQENSKWMQVLAATLNGTGMQTFGMTSGTSNCTEDGVMQASREKEAFVEANIVELRRDLAKGNGEYISSLASLYGCKGDAVVGFTKAMRTNAQVLLPSQNAQESLKAMDKVIDGNNGLKQSCQG